MLPPKPGAHGSRFVVCASGLDLPFRHYLGLLDGEAVATVSLLLGAGVAGVHYVATLPPARKRGIGAAMTLAALQDGRSLGYQIGVLQSPAQGFPVYQRMDFVEVCKIDLFVGRAKHWLTQGQQRAKMSLDSNDFGTAPTGGNHAQGNGQQRRTAALARRA